MMMPITTKCDHVTWCHENRSFYTNENFNRNGASFITFWSKNKKSCIEIVTYEHAIKCVHLYIDNDILNQYELINTCSLHFSLIFSLLFFKKNKILNESTRSHNETYSVPHSLSSQKTSTHLHVSKNHNVRI